MHGLDLEDEVGSGSGEETLAEGSPTPSLHRKSRNQPKEESEVGVPFRLTCTEGSVVVANQAPHARAKGT